MFRAKRDWVDAPLDRLRFEIDRLPGLDYQPLPWLGIPKARRSSGVRSRWDEIRRTVTELNVVSAVDVGCNVGYYSIALAKLGITTLGIESHPKYFRTFLYAVRKLELHNVGCLSLQLSPGTVTLVPPTECVLFLSVWHHLVRHHGLDAATDTLRQVWDRTSKVCFFETGEDEMPDAYGLPAMEPDAVTFLSRYLEDSCQGGEVAHLGLHDAFSPNGTISTRNLFAVLRS